LRNLCPSRPSDLYAFLPLAGDGAAKATPGLPSPFTGFGSADGCGCFPGGLGVYRVTLFTPNPISTFKPRIGVFRTSPPFLKFGSGSRKLLNKKTPHRTHRFFFFFALFPRRKNNYHPCLFVRALGGHWISHPVPCGRKLIFTFAKAALTVWAHSTWCAPEGSGWELTFFFFFTGTPH